MFLARHGQTMFNITFGATKTDPGIKDPPLTEDGQRQADELAGRVANLPVTRIICSPYTRALQTAHAISERLSLPISVNANIRERSAYVCDIGTQAPILAQAWPNLEFSHLDNVWWNKEEEPIPAFHLRCANFRDMMATTDDWAQVVVITHWGVIRSLTGQQLKNAELINCDPRDPHPPLAETWL